MNMAIDNQLRNDLNTLLQEYPLLDAVIKPLIDNHQTTHEVVNRALEKAISNLTKALETFNTYHSSLRGSTVQKIALASLADDGSTQNLQLLIKEWNSNQEVDGQIGLTT
jgi:hypothetical protein